MDHVERMVEQWARERPDLDTGAMAVITRLDRLAAAYRREMLKTVERHGLNSAKFDVLAALRRSGPPFALSPGALLEQTIVASGTMTNRINRLHQDGLVTRVVNPRDHRGFLIALTTRGRRVIDRALVDHAATQTRLLGGLPPDRRSQLSGLLKQAAESLDID